VPARVSDVFHRPFHQLILAGHRLNCNTGGNFAPAGGMSGCRDGVRHFGMPCYRADFRFRQAAPGPSLLRKALDGGNPCILGPGRLGVVQVEGDGLPSKRRAKLRLRIGPRLKGNR
jgi:hypothetical protein